jgi:hypothetical protein
MERRRDEEKDGRREGGTERGRDGEKEGRREGGKEGRKAGECMVMQEGGCMENICVDFSHPTLINLQKGQRGGNAAVQLIGGANM